MNKTKLIIAFAIITMMSATGMVYADHDITVPGTGDSQALLRKMARVFEHGDGHVQVFIPESIGSSGGVRAAASAENQLARVARPLKKKEEKFNLNYKEFALSPIVFVVNQSVTNIDNLSSEEIAGIYSGRITTWDQLGGPSHKIYVINREKGDSSHSVIEKNLARFKDIKKHAGITIYSTPETVAAIDHNKFTIGYAPLAMVKNTPLKVLKIDGLEPSQENILSNSYKLVTPFALVWKGELVELSRRFYDFVFGAKARDIMSDYGVIAKNDK